MSALILSALVTGVTFWIAAVVQQHARWHREEPRDEAWVTELKTFNQPQPVVHRTIGRHRAKN